MTPKEFFDKVVEMRRCQKEYLKNKRQIDLRISKQIEREVDEEIERVQKIYCKKAICFSCITRGNGFHPKEYTHVRFRFGYTKRTMLFELESITIGVGNTNWGAPDNECVFILKLGKCIKKNESKDSTEFQPKNL